MFCRFSFHIAITYTDSYMFQINSNLLVLSRVSNRFSLCLFKTHTFHTKVYFMHFRKLKLTEMVERMYFANPYADSIKPNFSNLG